MSVRVQYVSVPVQYIDIYYHINIHIHIHINIHIICPSTIYICPSAIYIRPSAILNPHNPHAPGPPTFTLLTNIDC